MNRKCIILMLELSSYETWKLKCQFYQYLCLEKKTTAILCVWFIIQYMLLGFFYTCFYTYRLILGENIHFVHVECSKCRNRQMSFTTKWFCTKYLKNCTTNVIKKFLIPKLGSSNSIKYFLKGCLKWRYQQICTQIHWLGITNLEYLEQNV